MKSCLRINMHSWSCNVAEIDSMIYIILLGILPVICFSKLCVAGGPDA